MLSIGTLKSFNSTDYRAEVQLAGSITAYLDNIPVARNIAASQMIAGRHVIVAIPGGNPKDACVIAVWAGAAGGGGGGGAANFLALTDTPSSYSGQAAKSAVVNAAQNALQFAQRATISAANKTIYVYKDATGNGDGTSWANAFTSIQAAIDSIEGILIHSYTIKVRKGSTPYRETVHLNSDPDNHPTHIIVGALTIEAEYYWYGDCEANATANRIVDTGAFANVAVGDKVMVLDLNGANGRAQGYGIGSVTSIAGAPNYIATDVGKTPTTNWKYVIVKTEISGSDDGTDGGTARDYCIALNAIENVTIKGFYLTYSDLNVISASGAKFSIYGLIVDNCDAALEAGEFSYLYCQYAYLKNGSERYGYGGGGVGYLRFLHCALDAPSDKRLFNVSNLVSLDVRYCYLDHGAFGFNMEQFAFGQLGFSTISANVATGLRARQNSAIRTFYSTNNATTPADPAGTTEGAYIA